MANPVILVTGATGKTGAAVVNRLLEKEVPVRALVHRRDARSEAFERRGVDVVVADMFDPDQVFDALVGVRRAGCLLGRPHPGIVPRVAASGYSYPAWPEPGPELICREL